MARSHTLLPRFEDDSVIHIFLLCQVQTHRCALPIEIRARERGSSEAEARDFDCGNGNVYFAYPSEVLVVQTQNFRWARLQNGLTFNGRSSRGRLRMPLTESGIFFTSGQADYRHEAVDDRSVANCNLHYVHTRGQQVFLALAN